MLLVDSPRACSCPAVHTRIVDTNLSLRSWEGDWISLQSNVTTLPHRPAFRRPVYHPNSYPDTSPALRRRSFFAAAQRPTSSLRPPRRGITSVWRNLMIL